MVQESEFIHFVAGVMGVSAEKLSLATAYGTILEWDSVMHLRLVMEAEAAYGVSFPLEVVPELKTLGDFYRRILESVSVLPGTQKNSMDRRQNIIL